MWEKTRQQPEPAVRNVPQAPPPPVAQPATYRPAEPKSVTTIGSAISIVGDIYSKEDLFMDGQVRGKVDIPEARLTIGPNGKAESNVNAREVVILGQVHGDIEASQKISIKKDGSLVGNIKTMGIVIDDEAYFKGSIDIVRRPAPQGD
jgi:cytoskeletal protein CcmA (bactofilin family)